ncbi:MAG: hypothetical protein NC293_02185 [Roseburia sp.]|nr:hypothetical protein [Roseburia sp.]
MEQEIRVTPEELYYLGGLMDAKYIDYEYVAAMEDIEIKPSMYQSKVKSALAAKGMLEEDFSGNMELPQIVKEIITPVFFGEFESNLDICVLGEEDQTERIKYHFYKKSIVKVLWGKGEWRITKCNHEDIIEEVKQHIFKTKSEIQDKIFDSDSVSQILVLKHVQIGKESMVKIYFLCEDVLFCENENEEIIPIVWEQVLEEAQKVMLPEKDLE